ncbi:hypothetical protein ACFQO4_03095 [Saliphagus sp. GCM10025334]
MVKEEDTLINQPFVESIAPKEVPTNLTCPNCRIRFFTNIFRMIDISAVGFEQKLFCPQCGIGFWPENGLLLTGMLHEGKGNFGIPLSLGGALLPEYKYLSVGQTHIGTTSLDDAIEYYDDYSVEDITIESVHKDNFTEKNLLDVEPSFDRFREVIYEDEVHITVSKVSETEYAVSANLQENQDGNLEIAENDKLSIHYTVCLKLSEVTDPPWLHNLRAAEESLRRGNTVSALPALISAFDNQLYRQIVLLLRSRGLNKSEAVEWLEDRKGGYNIRRNELAKEILEELVGERLSTGAYSNEWNTFQEIKARRDEIVHPPDSSISFPTQKEGIEYFNNVFNLMLGVFDLCWDWNRVSSNSYRRS